MTVEVRLDMPSPRFDPLSRVSCQFAPIWVPLGCHWVYSCNPVLTSDHEDYSDPNISSHTNNQNTYSFNNVFYI